MAQTIKTLKDGDLVREYLASFHNKLKFIKTINRQYDSRYAATGAKNGGELVIKNPNQFTVRTGAVMDTQDIVETTQTLTLATQKGVDINMSSVEMTMFVDDYKAMVIDPAMDKLAAMVEYDVMSTLYKDVFNLSGTPATTPASLEAVLNAGVKLSQGLAPEGDRHLLMDSLAMAGTVAKLATYFHKASEVESAFAEGYIGHAGGFKWWESNMIPNHTNGTRTDTTPITTITAAQDSAALVVTGAGNALTYAVGDIFTIADVYAINDETKQKYSHLQQFTVTTLATSEAGGAVTLAISPKLTASGVKQTVSVTAGSKALVNLTAGGSGAASAIYPQNLAYHKDAFTFVSADLYTDPSARMSRANIEGVSMRFWRGNDIINDKFPARVDVLYGCKTLRPEWAVRTRG